MTQLPNYWAIGSVGQLVNYNGHRTTSHLTFHNRTFLEHERRSCEGQTKNRLEFRTVRVIRGIYLRRSRPSLSKEGPIACPDT